MQAIVSLRMPRIYLWNERVGKDLPCQQRLGDETKDYVGFFAAQVIAPLALGSVLQ